MACASADAELAYYTIEEETDSESNRPTQYDGRRSCEAVRRSFRNVVSTTRFSFSSVRYFIKREDASANLILCDQVKWRFAIRIGRPDLIVGSNSMVMSAEICPFFWPEALT